MGGENRSCFDEKNNVCRPNLAYACGDSGQSGAGTVFYASKASFARGVNMASSCNYLEEAPHGSNAIIMDFRTGVSHGPTVMASSLVKA